MVTKSLLITVSKWFAKGEIQQLLDLATPYDCLVSVQRIKLPWYSLDAKMRVSISGELENVAACSTFIGKNWEDVQGKPFDFKKPAQFSELQAMLRELALPTKETDVKNQCDGCNRGLPVETTTFGSKLHRGNGGPDMQMCTADQYNEPKPDPEIIRERAYELFLLDDQGEVDNWLRAERELS